MIIFVQKELTAFIEHLKKANFIFALYSKKEKKKCKKDTAESSKQKKGNESKVNPTKVAINVTLSWYANSNSLYSGTRNAYLWSSTTVSRISKDLSQGVGPFFITNN